MFPRKRKSMLVKFWRRLVLSKFLVFPCAWSSLSSMLKSSNFMYLYFVESRLRTTLILPSFKSNNDTIPAIQRTDPLTGASFAFCLFQQIFARESFTTAKWTYHLHYSSNQFRPPFSFLSQGEGSSAHFTWSGTSIFRMWNPRIISTESVTAKCQIQFNGNSLPKGPSSLPSRDCGSSACTHRPLYLNPLFQRTTPEPPGSI